MKVDR